MSCGVLIVEDETDINNLLARIFTSAGYRAIQAFSGTEARLLMERERPELALLDLMLPGLPGEELLQEIREKRGWDIPVLVLSAKNGLTDKVSLLRTGADDYITKPFEPEEVLARAEAALRRAGHTGGAPGPLSYKNMKLYPEARRAEVNGKELSLTAHEFELLHLLLRTPGKVYSRESLYELVWQGGYYGENNTVNVHVSNLRKKIRETGAAEEYIHTVYGIGFKLD